LPGGIQCHAPKIRLAEKEPHANFGVGEGFIEEKIGEGGDEKDRKKGRGGGKRGLNREG